MNDPDSESGTIALRALDRLMADQRQALKSCSKILRCSFCTLALDRITLLTFVCRDLILHVQQIFRAFSSPETKTVCAFGERLVSRRISFGGYVVETELEWASLVADLTKLHLNKILDVPGTLRRMAQSHLLQTQMVRMMLCDMQHF